jgi:hypothetical protein
VTREIRILENRWKIRPNTFKIRCAYLFHFNLDLPVPRVYIVELPLPGRTQVRRHIRIQQFIDMYYLTHPQPEVIESGETEILRHIRHSLPER